MTEKEAIEELKAMTREQLELVPYDNIKWVCGCKGCKRYTGARDYGIMGEFYHKRIGWFYPGVFFFCATHWKFYKRLLKNFDNDTVIRKLVDFNKETIIPIIKGL